MRQRVKRKDARVPARDGARVKDEPRGAPAQDGAHVKRELRVWTYHRVSTIDQDPTLAREQLRGAVLAHGLVLTREIEETGSGARCDRPGLAEVLEGARRHAFGALVVWKIDRLARSSLDLLGTLRELDRAGVRLVVTTQGLDVRPGESDPVGRLVVTILAAVAEWERDTIRERTRLGLAAARARGVQLGRPRDPVDGELVRVLRAEAPPLSWAAIGATLGCTPTAARRALARLEGLQ